MAFPPKRKDIIMKRSWVLAAIVFAALFLASCKNKLMDTSSTQAPKHATVTMKDGTATAGTVVSSSDKEISIAGDDKITRTIPMDQVRSVEYMDMPAAAPSGVPPSPPYSQATPVEQYSNPPAVAGKIAEHPSNLPAATAKAPAAAVQGTPPERVAASVPMYELPIGTKVAVRTFALIDSAKAAEGQLFPGEVTKDVMNAEGDLVIPARSNTEIVIKSASKGGRFRGTSDLVLDLKSVTINGKRYAIQTAAISREGKEGMGTNKRTATYTGGGAVLGAIIGAIAGGGKGAAIGAASGVGAGAVTQAVTKGGSIKVPAETILTFKLDQPLTVSAER
jgi:hypothetical protein